MSLRNAYAVYRGYRVPHLQLIEHRRWWFTFSGVLIVLSLVGIIVSGFHFSIDFVGGAEHAGNPVTTDRIRVLDTYGRLAIQLVAGDQVRSVPTRSPICRTSISL